jgi:hypothetical protein
MEGQIQNFIGLPEISTIYLIGFCFVGTDHKSATNRLVELDQIASGRYGWQKICPQIGGGSFDGFLGAIIKPSMAFDDYIRILSTIACLTVDFKKILDRELPCLY